MNNVYKYSKDLVSVIIRGRDIGGGETVFYDGYRVIKHLHDRITIGAFERCIHECSLWIGHRAVISFVLTKKCSFHLSWG